MRQIQLEVSYGRNVIDGIKDGDVDASKWWLECYGTGYVLEDWYI